MSVFRAFAHDENPLKDISTVHISKSTAMKWIAQGTHRRIDKRTIQAVDPKLVGKIRHQDVEPPVRPNIANLAPLEVGGCVVRGLKPPPHYARLIGGAVIPLVYQTPIAPSHEELLEQYGFER